MLRELKTEFTLRHDFVHANISSQAGMKPETAGTRSEKGRTEVYRGIRAKSGSESNVTVPIRLNVRIGEEKLQLALMRQLDFRSQSRRQGLRSSVREYLRRKEDG